MCINRTKKNKINYKSLCLKSEKLSQEGFFARFRRSFFKHTEHLYDGFFDFFYGKKIDDELFEKLEEQLILADVGISTTNNIIHQLKTEASRKNLKESSEIYTLLENKFRSILTQVEHPLKVEKENPFVILVIGVNGVGKTTTVGKLSYQFKKTKKSVMLAAGDTFRAAAIEQLQLLGHQNKIPVVAQKIGADSASVVFDAMRSAKSKNIDVLLVDTAGRLQNKIHLMKELQKIVYVMKKIDNNAPHEVMLILDANNGQNSINQVKLFNETIKLTGISLTKLDGTAKGGIIISIANQFNVPIRYVGIGEKIEDLHIFNTNDFIKALF